MRRFNLLLALIVTAFALHADDIKYVFFMIGDGMGVNQVFATERYLGSLTSDHGREALTMTQFPNVGLSHTYSKNSGITDSAAGGTALSSFEKTCNGVIAMDSARVKPLTTIAELAKRQGKAVGIITSVSIDHATPAVFYAHVPDRGMYYEIGKQLSESDFDFFGGAWFLKPKGRNGDQTDLLEIVQDNGYTVLKGYEQYQAEGKKHDKVILTQKDMSAGALPYAIDRNDDDLTLPQITEAAIDFLEKKGKNKGFFLMVEGGEIDWACHGNDGATALNEVKDFDNAIKVAYEFYKRHPKETLIVVTADHETGGLALGNSDYNTRFHRIDGQRCSQTKLTQIILEALNDKNEEFTFEKMKDILKENLGLFEVVPVSEPQLERLAQAYVKTISGKKTDVKSEYFTDELIAVTAIRILNESSRLGWTTGAHSSAAVPVLSIGKGSEALRGVMQNNEIPQRVAKIAKYKK